MRGRKQERGGRDGAVGQRDADLSQHLHILWVGRHTERHRAKGLHGHPVGEKLYTQAMVGISSAPALQLAHIDKPKGCRRSSFDHRITGSDDTSTSTIKPTSSKSQKLQNHFLPPRRHQTSLNGTRFNGPARWELDLKRQNTHSAFVFKCYFGN